jgi:hypothetical protein
MPLPGLRLASAWRQGRAEGGLRATIYNALSGAVTAVVVLLLFRWFS